MKSFFTVLLFTSFLFLNAQNREKAFEINQRLGRGINYGNMFEAPSETAWGNQWKPEYAEIIAGLGFNHVRIPIRREPSDRSSTTAPFAISNTFLNRIKQVVDSAINNGLHAIINMHHHDELFENPDAQKTRFLSQWKQISAYFKDYPDSLLFEILNEPHGNITPEKWNVFAADALAKIREDNPDRIILIGTPEYGGLGGLSKLQLPADENIILTVHYYNPFQFTHQGASWVGTEADLWLGTKWQDSETERNVMRQEFAPLLLFSELQKVPVHIGEFGAYSTADMISRGKWTTFLGRYFEQLNWSWAYWEFSAGFGIYDPNSKILKQELVDALLHNEMPEPARFIGTPIYTSNFQTTNDGWVMYKQSVAAAQLSNSENSLIANITNGSTETWHVQLAKNNIQLQAGKKYRVSFKAKAETTRNFNSYVGKSVDPWSSYGGSNSIIVTDTFVLYSFVFDMNENDNSARMVFDLGKSNINFTVTDVKLEEIVLVPPTGISSFENVKILIYPNPVTDKLFVNNRDNFSEISIYNIQGKMVISKSLENQLNVICLNDLKTGMYFVTLTGNLEKHSVKIFKQ